MANPVDLINWRERLREARYSGTRRVKDADGSEVEYKSDAEMAAALDALDRQISGQKWSGLSYPIRTKGL